MKTTSRILSTALATVSRIKPSRFAEAIDILEYIKAGPSVAIDEYNSSQQATESSGAFSLTVGAAGASATQVGQELRAQIRAIQLRFTQSNRDKTVGDGLVTITKPEDFNPHVIYDDSGVAVAAGEAVDTNSETFYLSMGPGQADIYVIFGYQADADDDVVPVPAWINTVKVADAADTKPAQGVLTIAGSGFASSSGFSVRVEPVLPGNQAYRDLRELLTGK